MPLSLTKIAVIYLSATVVLHVSARLVVIAQDQTMSALAMGVAITAFAALCSCIWNLHRSLPLPGMTCCALAVTILGAALAVETGLLDELIGQDTARELSAHITIAALVLLAASILLLPQGTRAFLKEIVIPALFGKQKDKE